MATMTVEPTVTINGVTLSEGQAMTVRVALSSFDMDLDNGLDSDEHGRAMVALYRTRIREIYRLIFAARAQQAS